MSSIAFDTLKLAQALRDRAHFTPEQAEGTADAIAEAMQSDIATKTDITLSESALRSDISALRSDVKAYISTLHSEVKADIAELRGDMKTDFAVLRGEVARAIAEAKLETIKWTAGLLGFQTIAVIGTVIALVRH